MILVSDRIKKAIHPIKHFHVDFHVLCSISVEGFRVVSGEKVVPCCEWYRQYHLSMPVYPDFIIEKLIDIYAEIYA